MFHGVQTLVGPGAPMDIAGAQKFLEDNADEIRAAKPLVELTTKKACGGTESFRVRLTNYVAGSRVIALGAPGDGYQGVRRVSDIAHLSFVERKGGK